MSPTPTKPRRPWALRLLVVVTALALATVVAPPAGAGPGGCDNPEGLPVVTIGSHVLFTDPPPVINPPLISTPVSRTVLVDLEGARGAVATASKDWANPAEQYSIRLHNGEGDQTEMGSATFNTAEGHTTSNHATGFVADCERLTIAITQQIGPPPAPIEFELRIEPHDAAAPREVSAGAGDVTVLAVIVDSFNPYHHEFYADRMPGGNLPLDRPPHEWISGFPSPDDFNDYRPLDLTLPTDPDAVIADARAADDSVWRDTSRSEPDAINYHWVPGTKFVGAVDFTGNWQTDDNLQDGQPRHDLGNTLGPELASTLAGNTFGTCPECVMVAVVTDQHNRDRRRHAIEWATSQPWIDAVADNGATVSEESPLNNGLVYGESGLDLSIDVDQSRQAHERGQQHFTSAEGGPLRGVAPYTTYHGDEGLDWTTTVGGVMHDGTPWSANPVGVDLAGILMTHSTAHGDTVSSFNPSRAFKATTSVAGIYGRALLLARAALPGPSRSQAEGVIAAGPAGRCAAIADCPLADGALTRAELIHHLHAAAQLAPIERMRLNLSYTPVPLPRTPFDRDLAISLLGHGIVRGRDFGDVPWHDSIDRIIAPVLGERRADPIPQDVIAHQTVDSYCRQQAMGAWDGGYYREGETDLPGPDAERPLRTSLEAACTAIVTPLSGQ